MSHLIDKTTGRNAIAYVGETPWHGLGQVLTAGAPLETWQKEAGLDWEAKRAQVQYSVSESETLFDNTRAVLYRSDTKAPLGIVARGYNVHQPAEIIGFFRDLVGTAGFELEVAGAIKGGKRIWALAKVNKEACVLSDDLVRGYLLLSTTFDGSAATSAQFTSIRVVCNNTLSAADVEQGATRVSIWHASEFDADAVKNRLGIVANAGFDGMMERFRAMARRSVTSKQVDAYVADLFAPYAKPGTNGVVDVRQSRAYKQVLDLFEGGAIGSDTMPGVRGTVWGLLNSVTEYIDHRAGRTQDSRLSEAWFGRGAAIKAGAYKQAVELAAS